MRSLGRGLGCRWRWLCGRRRSLPSALVRLAEEMHRLLTSQMCPSNPSFDFRTCRVFHLSPCLLRAGRGRDHNSHHDRHKCCRGTSVILLLLAPLIVALSPSAVWLADVTPAPAPPSESRPGNPQGPSTPLPPSSIDPGIERRPQTIPDDPPQ